MYGTQTRLVPVKDVKVFENDVKMYGTQTQPGKTKKHSSLRMM